MFIDKVAIRLAAGKGGNGVVAWTREKYIPKGGPCGGNGGRGGSIILRADTQVYSLDAFRNNRKYQAENGKQGGYNCRAGRKGKDLVIKVPCGTLVKDPETGEILKDLTDDKDQWTICEGGRGGKGNHCFKTPTNRAPNYATPGKEGDMISVELELKLIADVGLVGFPNAGKSTLISSLCDVKVKTAPYPFTTLSPNLGFIQREDYTRLFLADIPGIIADAHLDRGLGLEFLRHIERTSLLLFVLDASGVDGRSPADDFAVLKKELEAYQADVGQKPFLVVLNKIDTEVSSLFRDEFYQTYNLPNDQVFEVSALTGEGLAALSERMIDYPISRAA